MDLLYKLASRACEAANGSKPDRSRSLPTPGSGRSRSLPTPELDSGESSYASCRELRRLLKVLDSARTQAVDQLRQISYYHRQIVWLQDRSPDAELTDVPGLVKLVDVQEIEANDWSLTPGRYVGVAPPVEDEDFDFEEAIRDIHTELADLNKGAAELAGKIAQNFEELGI